MSGMADRLRRSHEYIRTHNVYDHSIMLEAADHLERVEESLDGGREYIKEMDQAAEQSIVAYRDMAAELAAAVNERAHAEALLRDLHYELAEAHAGDGSSSDLVQVADGWFTKNGYPTIIYS